MTQIAEMAAGARAPDLVDGAWRLWRATTPPLDQEVRGHAHATLGVWLLHQPGVHAFWSYWWVTLIHLRPGPGLQPAGRRTSSATHEVLCVAQNPEHAPDPDSLDSLHHLMPPDWCWQLTAPSDALAVRAVDVALREAYGHRVPVDGDYARFWADMLRSVVRRLAAS